MLGNDTKMCMGTLHGHIPKQCVGYPLSMCHLSQHQLHDLQKKFIPTLMNKMGIARTHAHGAIIWT
jgi:hypothetical protein